MCSLYQPDGTDTQDLRRVEDEHREVRDILKKRQQPGAPTTYRILAGLSGSIALALWGYIFADSAHEPGAPIDRAYGAFLTFSAVVAVAAIMAGIIWLRERDASRHRAEADLIRTHYQARQVKAVREAITVFLRDGDEAARQVMAHTQQIVNGGASVSHLRGRGK